MHEAPYPWGVSDVKKSGMLVVSPGIFVLKCSRRNATIFLASSIFKGFTYKTLSVQFKVVSFWSHLKLEWRPDIFVFNSNFPKSRISLIYLPPPPPPTPPYSHTHKYIPWYDYIYVNCYLAGVGFDVECTNCVYVESCPVLVWYGGIILSSWEWTLSVPNILCHCSLVLGVDRAYVRPRHKKPNIFF